MPCGDRFPSLVVIRCRFIDAVGDGEEQHAVLSVSSVFFLSFLFLAEKLFHVRK